MWFVTLLFLNNPTLVTLPKNTATKTQRASSCCPADTLFSVRRVTTQPHFTSRRFRDARLNLRPLAMFSARQTSKEPRSGPAVFLFVKPWFLWGKWPSQFSGWSFTSSDLQRQSCRQQGRGGRSRSAECLPVRPVIARDRRTMAPILL